MRKYLYLCQLIMEKLLHYTWKHRLYPLGSLATTDDKTVEVIDPGLHNTKDAGPDFFNAKIRVNGTEWVGNVELHLKASDWYRHGHDRDSAYDNVILHVVTEADMEVTTSSGRVLPQMVLTIPERLRTDYEHLLHQDKYPPCYERIPDIPKVKTHMFMSALQTERLERKTREIVKRMKDSRGSWEDAYFQTLARNFGFGINSEAFETWAMTIDLNKAAHHRDDLFQIEALFIGQAGLTDRVDERYSREYAYLQKKFGLHPMKPAIWKYLRTRPQNFPHVRVMELARMYHEQRTGLSQMLDCKDVKAIGKLLGVKGSKLDLIVINTVIPIMFAYGRENGKEALCERAFDLFEEIKPEDNNIVRMWQECGLQVRNAGDSQALIQLKKEYCDKKECLRCRIGREVLTAPFLSCGHPFPIKGQGGR